MFTARHDIEISGAISLVWRTFYSTSRLTNVSSGTSVGIGWTHPFDLSLALVDDEYVFSGPDCWQVSFHSVRDRVNEGSVLRNLGACAELWRDDEAFEVRHWHHEEDEIVRYFFRESTSAKVFRLDAIADVFGNRLQISYDAAGRFHSARQTLEGRELGVDYDTHGRVSDLWLKAPQAHSRRNLAQYFYDRQGCLIEVTNSANHTTRYEYDDAHQIIREEGHGGLYRMTYDSLGRCVQTVGERGFKKTTLDYSERERATRVRDSLGNTTLYLFNEAGQVELTVASDGATDRQYFDEFGRRVANEDALGRKWTYGYNRSGDKAWEIDPAGNETRFEHNSLHLTTRIVESDGGTHEFQYEDDRVLVAYIDPSGDYTKYQRTCLGVLLGILLPNGERVEIRVDEDWTEQTVTDRYGERRTRFDDTLTVIEKVDAKGYVTSFVHDEYRNLLRVLHPDGTSTKYERYPNGLVRSETDGAGRSRNFQYSSHGRLESVVDDLGNQRTFEWDTEGRMTKIVDEEQRTAHFSFDVNGNLIKRLFFDGGAETYQYDLAGQLTEVMWPDGSFARFEYDLLGDRALERHSDGSMVRFRYDAFGQVVWSETRDHVSEFEYDKSGRLVREVQDAVEVRYTYTNGELNRREFSRSRHGPLEFMSGNSGEWSIKRDGKVLQSWLYDSRGLLAERRMRTASERFSYDPRTNLTRHTLAGPNGAALMSRRLAFDGSGNLLMTDEESRQIAYDYDAANRLVRKSDGNDVVEYSYDRLGSITSRSNPVREFAYDLQHHCIADGVADYAYDIRGRLSMKSDAAGVTQFEWNGLGQLVKVIHPNQTTTTYSYDGLGRRASKNSSEGETRFFYAGDELLAEEYGGKIVEYYMHKSRPCVVWRDGSAFDIISSETLQPLAVVDESGWPVWRGHFDEWGALVLGADKRPALSFRFAGQYADSETGFHFNRARYYNPSNGHFTSPDPIGIAGGLNEYLYAPNPTSFIDPSGTNCNRTGCAASRRRTQARVRRMRGEMTEGEHARTTYATAEVLLPNGDIEVRVSAAGAEGYVRPGIRRAAGTEMVAVEPWNGGPRVNDAERHLIRSMEPGETLLSIGATRPMCDHCQGSVDQRGLGDAVSTPRR